MLAFKIPSISSSKIYSNFWHCVDLAGHMTSIITKDISQRVYRHMFRIRKKPGCECRDGKSFPVERHLIRPLCLFYLLVFAFRSSFTMYVFSLLTKGFVLIQAGMPIFGKSPFFRFSIQKVFTVHRGISSDCCGDLLITGLCRVPLSSSLYGPFQRHK